MSPEYLLTIFIVCLAPGIGVVYTLSVTLGQGLRGGIWASVGCTLATVLHLVVALAGLAAVLHASAVLFQTVKYAGVAYLLWMAWAVLKGTGGLSVEPAAPQSAARIVWRGIVLNILNPKISIFFVAFLPQFMSADASHAVVEVLMLGSVFVGLTFAVFVVYGQIAGVIRDRVLSSRRAMDWVRRIVAATFAAFAVRLALSER